MLFHQLLTMFEILTTIANKIIVTPKGVYFLISKLHSILAVAKLLAHNNISQIFYCGQISLVNCSFSAHMYQINPLRLNALLKRC